MLNEVFGDCHIGVIIIVTILKVIVYQCFQEVIVVYFVCCAIKIIISLTNMKNKIKPLLDCGTFKLFIFIPNIINSTQTIFFL